MRALRYAAQMRLVEGEAIYSQKLAKAPGGSAATPSVQIFFTIFKILGARGSSISPIWTISRTIRRGLLRITEWKTVLPTGVQSFPMTLCIIMKLAAIPDF